MAGTNARVVVRTMIGKVLVLVLVLVWICSAGGLPRNVEPQSLRDVAHTNKSFRNFEGFCGRCG